MFLIRAELRLWFIVLSDGHRGDADVGDAGEVVVADPPEGVGVVVAEEDGVGDISVEDPHDADLVVGEPAASATGPVRGDVEDAGEGEVSVDGDLSECERHVFFNKKVVVADIVLKNNNKIIIK